MWFAGEYSLGFEARIDTGMASRWGKFPLLINGAMIDVKFETVEAAKAYAQANYAERVAAALSLPRADQEVVEALAVAAANLNVATDGMESIRPQRQAVLDALARLTGDPS
jgi:hypothetical protein